MVSDRCAGLVSLLTLCMHEDTAWSLMFRSYSTDNQVRMWAIIPLIV